MKKFLLAWLIYFTVSSSVVITVYFICQLIVWLTSIYGLAIALIIGLLLTITGISAWGASRHR